jgi:hypothetical protein
MTAAIRILAVLALVAFGWVVGRAQTPAPDFTIAIDAPAGRTHVRCMRGCTLQGARDEGNPNNTPVTRYMYECSGDGVQRCQGHANGWVTR